MSERLLFISRDPGGTNKLVALRDILVGDACNLQKRLFLELGLLKIPEITIVAKDYAKTIWQQNDIGFLDWPDLKSKDDIAAYIGRFNPDHIITSTCHIDDRTEQMVWRAAKILNIPTMTFLDTGKNIEIRFTDDDGHITLPDRVAVLDDSSIEPLLSLGLPRSMIKVVGSLTQDYLTRHLNGNATEDLWTQWDVQEGETIILFASDYVREMQDLGFVFEVTEFECLDFLIEQLATQPDFAGLKAPYRLIIRPHPKDTPGKYDDYPGKTAPSLSIRVDASGPSGSAILASDTVAGLGSALLNEAKILGVSVLELGERVKHRKDL